MRIDNVEQFKDLLTYMGDLYERKNADYGGAIEKAVHEFGYVYSACMLFNKFERFRNLINKEDYEGKVGESLIDTLLDMANYAVETARIMQNDLEFINEVQRIDEVALHPVKDCGWADWGDEI